MKLLHTAESQVVLDAAVADDGIGVVILAVVAALIQDAIKPLADIFIPLFFAMTGSAINLRVLFQGPELLKVAGILTVVAVIGQVLGCMKVMATTLMTPLLRQAVLKVKLARGEEVTPEMRQHFPASRLGFDRENWEVFNVDAMLPQSDDATPPRQKATKSGVTTFGNFDLKGGEAAQNAPFHLQILPPAAQNQKTQWRGQKLNLRVPNLIS